MSQLRDTEAGDTEAGDTEVLSIPASPQTHSIPRLSKGERFHVFISYSSGDSFWVYGLIHKLEETLPSLRICYHERDFLPGKTIIDNMVESIKSSKKILMVLSPDFVRSRWCLFEANLSFFQDCMGHKAIIPVILKPCLIPLHLSHLTYLEAEDEQFFEKLVQVILSSSDNVAHSTLVHYQPSSLYNGKTIVCLPAVNESSEDWQPGVFCNSFVHDQLRAFVDDPELYQEAIGIINDVKAPRSCLRFITCRVLLCVLIVLLMVFLCILYVEGFFTPDRNLYLGFRALIYLPFAIASVVLMPLVFTKVVCWHRRNNKELAQQMVLKTGQANLLLMKFSLLAGSASRTQLFFVYISLQQCQQTFRATFGSQTLVAEKMWEKAIVNYSSAYTCCMARKHFPLNHFSSPSHCDEGMCFCQYVATQLRIGQ